MVALNDSALAARAEAERLRGQARALRSTARGNVADSHERVGAAHFETGRARAWRRQPLPSPWSDLRWLQAYETLERTLVPLP